MSFATPGQFFQRVDTRTLGQLVSDDNVEQGQGELLTDENVQAALDDAAAEIVLACVPAQRYTLDDLIAVATDPRPEVANSLIKLNIVMATINLFERRYFSEEEISRAVPKYQWAIDLMENLRTGHRVFDLLKATTSANMSNALVGGARLPLSSVVPIFGVNNWGIGLPWNNPNINP
jgi:hypothetical protein